MVEPVDADSRGIINPHAGLTRFALQREVPSGSAARFVAWYWLVSWNLGPGERHAQEVLSHPGVNVVFTSEETEAHGVMRARGTRVLEGRDWALGTQFRPGGFRPFIDAPVSSLTDRSIDIAVVFGASGSELAAEVRSLGDGGADVATLGAVVDGFIADRAPAEHGVGEEVSAVVEAVAADPSIVRVDVMAATLGVGTRQLQRLFAEHVGVSPKWVIRRYRLYEAAERAARGVDVDWAGLAVDLGYSDQSHLTRDFTDAIGMSPSRYAQLCSEPVTPSTAAAPPGTGR